MPPKAATKRKRDATDTTASASKKATKAPTNAKLYKDTLKAIDADIKKLDAKVKKMDPNSMDITTDTYADECLKHLKSVKQLAEAEGGVVMAFDLCMAVADASHTDMEASIKMCGYGESEEPFGELDEQLLALIELRAAQQPAKRQENLPEVPRRWTREDADVGVFKTGWPNKQQRNEMDRQKLEWEKDRRIKRRERREEVEDWVAVALSDLKEERDYLAEYGVKKYFPKSIAKLQGLLAAENAPESQTERETATTEDA